MRISHVARALFQTLPYHRMMEILNYHRLCKLLDVAFDGLLLLSDVHYLLMTGSSLRERGEGLLAYHGYLVDLAHSLLRRLPFLQLRLRICVPESPPLHFQALPTRTHKHGILEKHGIGIVWLHHRGERQPGQGETHLPHMLPHLVLRPQRGLLCLVILIRYFFFNRQVR